MRRGENALSAVREGCCRLLDHLVGTGSMDELVLMADDPDPHVRAMAAELVGKFAHSDARAVAALRASHTNDPSPAVRKKAGW